MIKHTLSKYSMLKKAATLSTLFMANNVHASASLGVANVCGDKAGWPPYTYEKESTITGASADTIRHVLKQAGYNPSLMLLPWKRCLTGVENGAINIALDATQSKDREEKYYISDAFYSIRSGLFYIKDSFKEKPVINSIKDMQQYSFCGIHGYNYSMYNIPKNSLDTKSWDEKSRIRKLRQGRCDFIIGDVEILQGFSKMGVINIDDMESIPIPSSKPKTFHALITKNALGKKYLEAVNAGLQKIKEDGTYNTIFSEYGITP